MAEQLASTLQRLSKLSLKHGPAAGHTLGSLPMEALQKLVRNAKADPQHRAFAKAKLALHGLQDAGLEPCIVQMGASQPEPEPCMVLACRSPASQHRQLQNSSPESSPRATASPCVGWPWWEHLAAAAKHSWCQISQHWATLAICMVALVTLKPTCFSALAKIAVLVTRMLVWNASQAFLAVTEGAVDELGIALSGLLARFQSELNGMQQQQQSGATAATAEQVRQAVAQAVQAAGHDFENLEVKVSLPPPTEGLTAWAAAAFQHALAGAALTVICLVRPQWVPAQH